MRLTLVIEIPEWNHIFSMCGYRSIFYSGDDASWNWGTLPIGGIREVLAIHVVLSIKNWFRTFSLLPPAPTKFPRCVSRLHEFFYPYISAVHFFLTSKMADRGRQMQLLTSFQGGIYVNILFTILPQTEVIRKMMNQQHFFFIVTHFNLRRVSDLFHSHH